MIVLHFPLSQNHSRRTGRTGKRRVCGCFWGAQAGTRRIRGAGATCWCTGGNRVCGCQNVAPPPPPPLPSTGHPPLTLGALAQLRLSRCHNVCAASVSTAKRRTVLGILNAQSSTQGCPPTATRMVSGSSPLRHRGRCDTFLHACFTQGILSRPPQRDVQPVSWAKHGSCDVSGTRPACACCPLTRVRRTGAIPGGR